MQPTTEGFDVERVDYKKNKEASFRHLRFDRFVNDVK